MANLNDNIPTIESPTPLQNVAETNKVNQTNRLNTYLRSKKFIFILISGLLIILIVTVPTILVQMKNNLTTPINKEEEFVPLNNINFTHTTKWRQNGITLLAEKFSKYDTMDIDDSGTIYISKYEKSQIVQWKDNMTVSRVFIGENGNGSDTNQLSNPIDILVYEKNNSIIICDYRNRRVVRWSLRNATNGDIIISNISCLGLAMDNRDYLYVSDHFQHGVKRWNLETYENTLVAAGNSPGADSTRLYFPYSIFVDKDYSVYVSDHSNHRIMKWIKDAKQGILVAGGYGYGKLLIQIGMPKGMIVDHFGNIYVCDSFSNRIVRWINSASEGSIVVGGQGYGNKSNQLNQPSDIVFDKYGNLYVLSTFETTRLQKFNIASN